MKTENKQNELSFPVVISAGKRNRATVCGKSIAGVIFTPNLIERIEGKKELPKDWTGVQFWVAKESLIKSLIKGKRPGKLFLMGKFTLPDNKTKSMYVRDAWLKAEALSFVASYWENVSK